MKVLKMCMSAILIIFSLTIELLSKIILVIGNWGIDTAIFLLKCANRLIK